MVFLFINAYYSIPYIASKSYFFNRKQFVSVNLAFLKVQF